MQKARPALITMRVAVAGLFLLASNPVFASANVSCRIDDRVLEFEFEAIAGRSSPINQIQQASIAIKPDLKLAKPKVEVKHENLVQQWMLGGDLRLQIEVYDEEARETINLVINSQLDRKKEKYFGGYVLTVTSSREDKTFKGRIKSCEAG